MLYSQEDSLNVHPPRHNEPSSEPEAACVSKVDHGLGEGEGETVHMGVLLRVPARSERKVSLVLK